MKLVFTIFGFIVISLFLSVVSFSCAADKIKASLGQEFALPAGKTAIINDENIEFKFAEVVGDSRCPKGVECVWAGEAKCKMLIRYNKSLSLVVYTQSGSSVARDFFNQYQVSFKLEPYPEKGKQIDTGDYKLVMMVTK